MTNTITGEKLQGEAKTDVWFTEDMLLKLNDFLKDTGYSTVNEDLKKEMIDEETGEVNL